MITQRSAAINKGVLTQISTLIVGRTISPQDRKSVGEWVEAHGTDDQKEKFWSSISSLPTNEKWFWAPARNVLVRARVRDRETYDSSFTPKIGDKRVEPKQLSPLDLDALRGKLAAVIEQAKADDPRELRATIKRLEAELKKRVPEAPTQKIVEVPVLVEGDLKRLEKIVADTVRVESGRQQAVEDIRNVFALASQMSSALSELKAQNKRVKGAGLDALLPPAPTRPIVRTITATKPMKSAFDDADGWRPSGPELKLLRILAARHPHPTTQAQLGILAGHPPTGSTVRNGIGALRSHGCATPGYPTFATDDGRALAGPVDPLPTGPELLEHWCNAVSGPEGKILRLIYEAHPRELTRDDLGEAMGHPPYGSTIRNGLGRLRTLELVVPKTLRLGETLAESK